MTVRLRGHVPEAVMRAHPISRLPGGETLTLALVLPLRDRAGLDSFLSRVYDPADALYHRYLTPDEFTARFGPTPQSYAAVADFARSRGLRITGTSPNRLLLTVSGSAAAVEAAFGLRLNRYAAEDGRVFHAPDADPAIPASLAGRLSGVIGLENATLRRPALRRAPAAPHWALKPLIGPAEAPAQIGSDPNTGALTPSDIKTAYNLSATKLTGAGQTLGLVELDGYLPSDIAAYEKAFGLPAIPLENILLDGFDGSAGGDAAEVTLDIELMAALAPGVDKILVYEAPNSNIGFLDIFNQIASENRAKEVSISWGSPESASPKADLDAENTAFQQMAAQGQSVFCASGDNGAYTDRKTLSVSDPASQPYMVAVGGTTLAVTGAGGAYRSETTWADPTPRRSLPFGVGGGGGISDVWAIPDYQVGFGLSTTKRNVPDVSLDADPGTGYAIYYSDPSAPGFPWTIYGGTSCAAPLWAAFAALVNQQRTLYGQAALGFANRQIYQIGQNATQYAAGFHDIADGSTNLFYPATKGFDNATGWGTFKGDGLLALLAPAPAVVSNPLASLVLAPTSVVGGLSVTGTVTLANPAPSGGATVVLASSDPAAQLPAGTVTIPAGGTSATFTVTTIAVTAAKSALITATYSGGSRQATLAVLPPPVVIAPATLTFDPVSVNGGNPSTATLTLTGPAPSGGLSVALSSSDPAVQVPATVTVPAGAADLSFPVTTTPVLTQVTATVTATAAGVSVSGTLTVLAPTLERLVLTPTHLPGGQSATGTLTLTIAAPKGGATIALTSSDPAAQVPATVSIPAAGTTTTFTVTTKPVAKTVIATITATYANLSQTATLTVQAARILSVATTPASVTGGSPAVGTVTLDSAVTVPGGLTVALGGTSAAGSFPATVTVPTGASSATFPITTVVVPVPVADTITATLDSISKTTVLSIEPIEVVSLTLNPAQVVAGGTSVGTVVVNAPAPPGGLAVTLSSAGTAETVPSGAVVPAGATSVTFPITAPLPGSATVAAVVGGQTRVATLTVTVAPGTSYPAGLNMISAPYDYSGQALDSLFGYAGVRLATWMPGASAYAFTASAPAETLHLGRGYWVRLPKAVTLARPGTPANPSADFSIPLTAGWNQIGDPFLVPIPLGSVHVSSGGAPVTFAQATSAAPLLVSELVYSYSPAAAGAGAYVWTRADSSLQPGLGYWIYAYQAGTLIIPHPG